MKCRPTWPCAHSAIAAQANSNSGPLSHRSTRGRLPRSTATWRSSAMRCSPVIDRSTNPPRHSRVCSSTMDTILIGRPSVVTSNWKSTAHTRSGASAVIGRGGYPVAFAPPPLRHPHALFAPKPLNLLVVHVPAVAAGIVINRSEPAPRMIAGVGAQPCPQRRIRILGRVRHRFVPLRSAVLPGNAAREPFTDPLAPAGDDERPLAGVPGPRNFPARSP